MASRGRLEYIRCSIVSICVEKKIVHYQQFEMSSYVLLFGLIFQSHMSMPIGSSSTKTFCSELYATICWAERNHDKNCVFVSNTQKINYKTDSQACPVQDYIDTLFWNHTINTVHNRVPCSRHNTWWLGVVLMWAVLFILCNIRQKI